MALSLLDCFPPSSLIVLMAENVCFANHTMLVFCDCPFLLFLSRITRGTHTVFESGAGNKVDIDDSVVNL